MRNLFTTIFMLLLATAGFSQYQNDMASAINTAPRKTSLTNDKIDPQWQAKAERYITEMGYHFKNNDAAQVTYAANSKQRLGFTINGLGYTVSPIIFPTKGSTSQSWKEEVLLLGINRENERMLPDHSYSMQQDKNEMNLYYRGFSIQYINSEKGLKQNFIVDKRLPGANDLELLLKYRGDLTAVMAKDGIEFKDSSMVKMLYKELKVWDACKNPLKARFELRENNVIAIIVDDHAAQYPITIDPMTKTPDWSGQCEGILPLLVGQLAVDAAYGFSMAGLGDVNGDGYADVAIGAPAMVDLIAGTGTLASVGAVFVYYGSATGLSTTPGAMLQPTTSVAGALFGYSIAGGDVNNDGKADVIVGAPMDNIIVNGQTGKIGKVYVFNGATLTTNTTAFLNIQLSGNSIIKEGINLSTNALFGFSVSVTEDLNGDGKRDIIVGAPTYAGIKNDIFGNPTVLDVQSGGAFVFLTNALNNNLAITKLEPIKTDLLGILSSNINGLLFGYNVDGVGDYNSDGHPDVVATAPAGIDLGLINLLLNGKLLQGSATVYYGTGAGVAVNPGAVLVATPGGLLTNLTGSIANLADLFGTSVRGVTDSSGVRTGNITVGAPLGGTIINVVGLELKTGTVSVFIKKGSSPAGNVIPDQILSSPRNNNTILGIIQSNLLFGYSLDNIYDVNCDGFADIVVGEPASSGAQLIATNADGGAAYVYLGRGDGTYYTSPYWSVTAQADGFLGVNATSMIGYSVAGAGKVAGAGMDNFIGVGSPSRTLDFGVGLLDLGNTYGSLFGLLMTDNGVGKSFLYQTNLCSIILLPVNFTDFQVTYSSGVSHLTWTTAQENNTSRFEIEHSVDGTNFTHIGNVAAAGFSTLAKHYGFNDTKPVAGINYYRLKVVDKDGKFAYSNIVSITVTVKGNAITAIYPAPFSDKINIGLASENSMNVEVELFDNTGKRLLSQTNAVKKGLNNIVVGHLEKLVRGFYIIKVQMGEMMFTEKLVK